MGFNPCTECKQQYSRKQSSGRHHNLPSACRSNPAGTAALQPARERCFCDVPLNTLSFWRVSLRSRTLMGNDRISTPSSASLLPRELKNPFISLYLHFLRWRWASNISCVCFTARRAGKRTQMRMHFEKWNTLSRSECKHSFDCREKKVRGLVPWRACQLEPP